MQEEVKRKPGRPLLSPGDKQDNRRTVHIKTDKWDWCQSQPGGAGKYLNRLIDADKARRK